MNDFIASKKVKRELEKIKSALVQVRAHAQTDWSYVYTRLAQIEGDLAALARKCTEPE